MANFITKFFKRNTDGPTRETGEQSSMPMSYPQASAAPVTFDTAMTISAFWACVKLLAETVAAMPLSVYRVNSESRERVTDYDLWRVLNYMPNRYQTKNEFFETFMLNLVSTGNFYGVIQRNGSGKIIGILPLMSAQMTVSLLEDGEKVFIYCDADGNTRVYSSKTIWHVPLFGNGIIGLSTLSYARQSLGIAIALDNRVSTLAGNGGKTTGILTIDHVLTEEQRNEVKKAFKGLTEGGQDQLFVLEAGFDYEQTALSPADMQMLENRRFQIEDICRFMGVPSVLVNDTSASTTWGSGIQQIVSGFYKLNLRPYLERIEASIKKHLMPMEDWDEYSFQFEFDSLLRADQETRFKTLKEGVNSGIITPNEARNSEGLPPKTGGDDIYLNGTMQPAGTGDENAN